MHPDCERGLTQEQIKAQREDFAIRDRAFETPLARRLRKQQEERDRDEQERLEAEHQAEIEREALAMKTELASLRVELVWAELRWKASAPSASARRTLPGSASWRPSCAATFAKRPTSTRTSRAMSLAGGRMLVVRAVTPPTSKVWNSSRPV